MSRSPRSVPVLLSALLLVLGPILGGCSLFAGPGPEDAASELAAALSKRDVGDLSLAGTTGHAAQVTLSKVLADMDDVPAEVRAVDVSTDGDTATAELVWTWRVAGRPWVTRSPLDLRKSGDDWRAVWDVRLIHPLLRQGSTLRGTDLLPTRGDVIGADGRHLVTNRSVTYYGFDKTDVPEQQAPALARRLALLVGIDPDAFAARVRKAGPKAYVPAITLRNGGADSPTTNIEGQVVAIDGARMTPGKLPLGPTSGFAAPLLGRVGQPTAEMVAKAKKQGVTLKATDQVGIGGLEQRYDDRLRGQDGAKVSLVDADGKGSVIHRTEPRSGRDLVTTLDQTAQTRAETALAGTTTPAALVAVRPSTGEIVAAANGPRTGSLNAATYGRYAPGSTFKIVSSLALLRAGVTPDTTVDCPTSVTVDGKRFENYDGYPASAEGRVSFRTAIANSCNTAVIGLRDKVSRSSLGAAAASLGLGVDHDTGFPAFFGQAPVATTETEAAADLIGQGKVLASPMAMAAVVASVASGRTVVPYLLDGEHPGASPDQPLTKSEATGLRTLMRAVVTEGSGRLLGDLPGAPAYAKTGTAEYGEVQKSTGAPRTHAWMVAAHGDLAVAVFVNDGSSGSGTAGPILKRFLDGFG